jgi:phage terminase large subunit GpA-like protein
MLEWQKTRERNEALDCRVYARAAAWIAGLDRWSEDRWQIAADDLTVAGPPDGKGQAPRRRTTAERFA